jgi:membrane protein required for colicin V production
MASKLVASVGLRPVDRALGAAFGVVRGVVLVLAATVVVSMTPLEEQRLVAESVGAGI